LSNYGVFVDYDEDSLPEGIYFLREPVEFQCFVVQLSLHLKGTNYKCSATIYIPGVERGEWDKLKQLQPHIDAKEPITSSCIPLMEDFLERGILDAYTSTWKQMRDLDISSFPQMKRKV